MGVIYLDCSMGAAGDMIGAALLELMPDSSRALHDLNRLGIPGVRFEAEKTEKCGVEGTHMHVLIHGEEEKASADGEYSGSACEHHHGHGQEKHPHGHPHEDEQKKHTHEHHHEDEQKEHTHEHPHGHSHKEGHVHMTLRDVKQIIGQLNLPETTRQSILSVYEIIAAAESKAHQCTVEEVHFHEVGAMDAIADITAACALMDQLRPEAVLVSPVCTGNGTVICAHGELPVPAPATADILKDMPSYAGDLFGEMCTPTGAALLKHFATGYTAEGGKNPLKAISRTGHGMGTKDFPRANCLTAYQGEC